MSIGRPMSLAEFAPARFDHALFRLFGFLLLRRRRPAAPDERRRFLLSSDRHANPIEPYVMSVVVQVVLTLYAFDLLYVDAGFHVAVAALISPFAGFLFVNIFIVAVAAVIALLRWSGLAGSGSNVGIQSAAFHLFLIAAAAWFAMEERPMRWAALAWLALAGANAVAAVALRLLRPEVDRVNERFRGPSSVV